MRKPVALPVLALTILVLSGCGGSSSPPAGGQALQKEVDDAKETLQKGVNDATEMLKGVKDLPSGTNFNVIQVSSGRLKTIADVSISTMAQDEKAVVDFGGRKLTVDFATGQVSLDDGEKMKLPAGTKEVEVRFVGGKLSVKADGADLSIPASRVEPKSEQTPTGPPGGSGPGSPTATSDSGPRG